MRRSYGFLGNRYRETKLALCRQLLGTPVSPAHEAEENADYRDRYEILTGNSLRDCPICGRGHMACIETFHAGLLPHTIAPDSS